MTDDVLSRWTAAMLGGDFEEAWRQTDRIELPRQAAERDGHFVPGPEHLVWNGTPPNGRRVLVRCEHGLGDSIQFLRYTPLLRDRASEVILKVQPALLGLLEGMAGADRVINAWTTDPDPPHDLAVECMELPYLFRSTTKSLPAAVPYLPTGRLLHQPAFIPPGEAELLRIGLIWASSGWDRSRSVQLAQLDSFRAIPGVKFFSLQQGDEAAEADAAPFPIEPLSARTAAVHDAAAAMLRLDLIITVDSMPAHLAGALGRPVWLLLQHSADWRWIDGRDDSPWYPTMRIFRQPSEGDWAGAIERMKRALEELAASRGRGLLQPSSCGL